VAPVPKPKPMIAVKKPASIFGRDMMADITDNPPAPKPAIVPVTKPTPKPTIAPKTAPKPTVAPELVPKPTIAPKLVPKPTVAPEPVPKPIDNPTAPKPATKPTIKPIVRSITAKPKVTVPTDKEPEPVDVPKLDVDKEPEPVDVPKLDADKEPEPVDVPKPEADKDPVDEPEPEPEADEESEPIKIYDKNPDWTKTFVELSEDVHPSWEPIMRSPAIIGKLAQVDKDFKSEMEKFADHIQFFPAQQSLIFNALKVTPFPPKAIILGQDPYHANANEAMGMCFSVSNGVRVPPSLVNIYKELQTDIKGFTMPKTGDLTAWAQQGVLLLNTALTVRQGQPESHLMYWKAFADLLIQMITEQSGTPIVFMLWGAKAKACKKLIKNPQKHLILESAHPSPMAANNGGWFGNHHFSKANEFLTKKGLTPITWQV